ncbi:Uncharacterized protein MSYG_3001 [Malassezia sympodialis ATCC 42132]|uniref:Uncharacterized protein n=1 Tax=Malassezia sympodialis (strain ATCC 42132) TaxID=1230383 RepID=A0A1M8A8Y6_MALS4|nr:Uncharacterized protein MSYG_3001 [Malassezia sympodialis ATCC 42132]
MSGNSVESMSLPERLNIQARNLAALSKYQQNLENYERNTGHKHPLAKSKPEDQDQVQKQAQQNAPLQFPEKRDEL